MSTLVSLLSYLALNRICITMRLRWAGENMVCLSFTKNLKRYKFSSTDGGGNTSICRFYLSR